jgi:hypothetical protein
MKHTAAAITDFQKAEDLWEKLGEKENAADAAWKQLKLQEAIPKSALKHLSSETALIKVAVIRDHQRRVADLPRSVARRSEPGSGYWSQLLKDARARVAVDSVTW